MVWHAQDARARFGEFVDASLRDGPQIVTRRGVEVAALLSIDEWRRLTYASQTIKRLLLAPCARFEIPVPKRSRLRRRQLRGTV
jgi:antitoxin Phd